MRFEDLHLIDPLLRAVHAEGYTSPTPIQAQAIPHVLAGRDLLGLAQTGTGKTAAFALPILQRLAATPHKGGKPEIRVLVLTPTRELASQVGESFSTYGRNLHVRNTVIFGGVGQSPQEQALRRGIEVLVATPGRLLDLMQQRLVNFSFLEVFVLDEADRMLDMGFIHDVKRVIAALPRKRQTLFFSATMPREAQQLADAILIDPARVAVTPPATTAEKVDQLLYFVAKAQKPSLLIKLLREPDMSRTLVFTRTKHGANRVAEKLSRAGIQAEAIHGNKSQGARERALGGFKSGDVKVLVATDIAARGIDVESISHVVNFDLPNIPETYVHRIGRTARAGASGTAISFCDRDEREFLRDIERLTRQRIPVADTPTDLPAAPEGESHERSGGGGRGRFGHGRPPHGRPHGRPQQGRPSSEPHRESRAAHREAEPARAPFRYERPASSTGGSEPAWTRYSHESSARPAQPAPRGGRGRRRR